MSNSAGLLGPLIRFPISMDDFLRIDDCQMCHRPVPWEWIPAVALAGKPLAGTGIWTSQLVAGHCATCAEALEAQHQEQRWARELEERLVTLLGGVRPYREFTFQRYQVTHENRAALARARDFDPFAHSLYLWGPCGVGKTHLAYAAARRCFERTLSVVILPAYQLSRRVRMKDPDQEQASIDHFIGADVLLLDDLGAGTETTFGRQVLQEILDARNYRDQAGLIVTSAYSLDALAQKMGHDAIASRLAGMCQIVEIRGTDYRLKLGALADDQSHD